MSPITVTMNDVPHYSSIPRTRAQWHRAYREAVTYAKANEAIVAIELPDGRFAQVSGQPLVRDEPQMIERLWITSR